MSNYASSFVDVAATRDGSQRFVVGPQSELWIAGGSGDVSVSVGEASVIGVRGRGDSWRSAKGVRFNQEGNRVRLHLKGSDDYEVTVPGDCRVRIQSSSGDLQARGLRAPASFETSSGDIHLEDIVADCTIRTSSGDVTGNDIAGALRLSTSSGDSEILASRLHSFDLHSTSGDITVETPLAVEGKYAASTSSGDVHLLLPPGSAATLRLRTSSGGIESDLPAEILQANRRQWEARLNGGGARVEMSSSSGSVYVESGQAPPFEGPSSGAPEPAVAAPPAPIPSADLQPQAPARRDDPPADAAPDQTTVILGMLERGEISVEEAMARLDGLS